MKTAKDLSRAELEQIVTDIQSILWPSDCPDAEWSSDEIERVAEVMDSYGLRPEDLENAVP
ncbi:MAG: hypothetical protein AB7H90_01240 [Alphaproteobacteria bacterium]